MSSKVKICFAVNRNIYKKVYKCFAVNRNIYKKVYKCLEREIFAKINCFFVLTLYFMPFDNKIFCV